jgi:di/tricarboxylate transporter
VRASGGTGPAAVARRGITPTGAGMEIVIVSALVVAVVYLLASERIPVDLTAIGVMVVLMVAGILTPREAMAGFANPAPLTIGALLIASQGLIRTGALDFITVRIIEITGGRGKPLLLLALLITGAFSSFINNTPVVVLFITIIMTICARYGLAPSKFLLPVSYVSILAGTTTLIGTSTNILVSDLAVGQGQAPLGMFELTRLAFPVAITGALYLYFLGFRLLPQHRTPILETQGEDHLYLSELLVPEGSPLIGHAVCAKLADGATDLELYEVIRGDEVLDPQARECRLAAGDILLVKASASDLAHVLEEQSVVLPKGEGGTIAAPYDDGHLIVELIVPPNSGLLGRRLAGTYLAHGSDLHVIGVQRRNVHYSQQKLSELRLIVGDILLVQCSLDTVKALRAESDVIVLEDVLRRIVNRRKAPLALGIFGAMVVAAATGLADILVCAMTAAFLMILTRCLNLRDAYRAVDVKVLVLIIGTLALGAALQKTGAADVYARGFLAPFQGQDPGLVLAALIVLTSVLSHFLSNNSTAVLLVPVAVSTAAAIGVDPRPFVVGICFGASSCFATPIGYQTNLLVMSPGGYRFVDYLKLGMPLNLLVWVAASLFIPRIWPF